MPPHPQLKKLLATLLISLTTLVAVAITVVGQRSERPSTGLAPHSTSAPTQSLQDRPLRGASDAERAPASRSQGGMPDARPIHSDPPLFLPTVTYASGGYAAVAVAIGDLNGDGKPDLAVANNGSDTVGVLLGRGDGTFSPVVTYNSGGVGPWSVAIADVNGDGRPDLVVANCTNVGQTCAVFDASSGNGLVAVLLGNGDGTFGPAVTYNSGGWEPQSLVVADVNGDRKPDVVVGNLCISAGCEHEDGTVVVGVLLGNGDGTFQDVVTHKVNGVFGTTVAVADVNLDGKPDLLFAICTSDVNCPAAISVFLGNGDSTFQPAVIYSSGGKNPEGIAVADVNKDGFPDLIVSNWGSSQVGILLGKGDGSFPNVVNYPAGGLPSGSVVTDINADGNLDVVVPTINPNTAGIFLGNGDGTFQSILAYDPGGGAPDSIAVGDINRDGRLDLVVANYYQTGLSGPGTLGVLLNNSGPKNSTTTALASSLNPSIYEQAVTWTATVTSSGSITPTGKVNFTWSGHRIGAATLNSSGVATLTKSNLNADTYPLTAVYVGDAANLGSTSAMLNQVVLETTSTATLTSSPNPSTQGEAVTFIAKISSPTVLPTGPVTFTAGKTVLGTAQLSGGKATLTISWLAVGSTKVTATYNGDSNIAKSSASVIQTVQ